MKKMLALLLCLVLALGLAACGGGETPDPGSQDNGNAVSGTDSGENASSDGDEEWQPKTDVPNQVLACDQYNKRIVVYDMDLVGEDGNLDDAEIWEYPAGSVASIKYREDTPWGDVVLFVGSNGPAIVTYPGKELLWEGGAGKGGSNPHSIEILPSGNVVTASSTDGLVRIFNTAQCMNDDASVKFSTYELPGAHGVLWDPEYEVLWAIGDYDLIAYQVKQEDGVEILRQVGGIGGELPTTGGHDLSADLTDTGYLWCTTNAKVYRFDKEENEFVEKFDQYAKLSKNSVKGFGNNKNGNFFLCNPNHGEGRDWEGLSIADWCTDTIYYGYWKSEHFLYVQECVSETAAFYKVRVFYGQYQ